MEMSKEYTEFEDELLTQQELLTYYPKLKNSFRRGDLAVLIRVGSVIGVIGFNAKAARTTVKNFRKFLQERNARLREQIIDPESDNDLY